MSSFSGDGILTGSTRFVAIGGSGNASQNLTFTLDQIATAFNLSSSTSRLATFDESAATQDILPSAGTRNTLGYTGTGEPVTLTISTSTITQGTATTPIYIDIKDQGGDAFNNNIIIETEDTQTIDGAGLVTITANYGVIRLYSNGSQLFTV